MIRSMEEKLGYADPMDVLKENLAQDPAAAALAGEDADSLSRPTTAATEGTRPGTAASLAAGRTSSPAPKRGRKR